MAKIVGLQKRGQFDGSEKGYSDYDDYIESRTFSIYQDNSDRVTVFFPETVTKTQGVGLTMPKGLAVAVGRALLSVGEGILDEANGQFN